ncbi:MAG: twin-arginine translocase TatA/TatE family subunit [Actinomycetota bacterium]|nr:twin-arginine translocase TatA/TatE family subunit [Actinomycetota bacterium]
MFRNPIVDALVVLVIVLLFFGPKRLPELGRSLGSSLRGFKDEITSGSDDADGERPELTRASDETGTGAPPTGTAASQVGAERRP